MRRGPVDGHLYCVTTPVRAAALASIRDIPRFAVPSLSDDVQWGVEDAIDEALG